MFMVFQLRKPAFVVDDDDVTAMMAKIKLPSMNDSLYFAILYISSENQWFYAKIKIGIDLKKKTQEIKQKCKRNKEKKKSVEL